MADQNDSASAEVKSYKTFVPEWARDPKFEPVIRLLNDTFLPAERTIALTAMALGMTNDADFIRASAIFNAVQLGSVVAMIDVTGTEEQFEQNLADFLAAVSACARDARPSFVAKHGNEGEGLMADQEYTAASEKIEREEAKGEQA